MPSIKSFLQTPGLLDVDQASFPVAYSISNCLLILDHVAWTLILWDAFHNYVHKLQPRWWLSAMVPVIAHLFNNFVVSRLLASARLSCYFAVAQRQGTQSAHTCRSSSSVHRLFTPLLRHTAKAVCRHQLKIRGYVSVSKHISSCFVCRHLHTLLSASLCSPSPSFPHITGLVVVVVQHFFLLLHASLFLPTPRSHYFFAGRLKTPSIYLSLLE